MQAGYDPSLILNAVDGTGLSIRQHKDQGGSVRDEDFV